MFTSLRVRTRVSALKLKLHIPNFKLPAIRMVAPNRMPALLQDSPQSQFPCACNIPS